MVLLAGLRRLSRSDLLRKRLHDSGAKMVDTARIELAFPACKTGCFPLADAPMDLSSGVEPLNAGFAGLLLADWITQGSASR